MVKYCCDICGKEVNGFQENIFFKTFNDNVKQDELIDSFNLILSIEKLKFVKAAYVCKDCFIKYLESALKQMKKEIASDVADKESEFRKAMASAKKDNKEIVKKIIKYMHEKCNIEFYELWYAVKDYVKLESMFNWMTCEEKKYKCKYVKANPIEEITKETLSNWVDGYLKTKGGKKAQTNRKKEN
jgi:hypothetical protein